MSASLNVIFPLRIRLSKNSQWRKINSKHNSLINQSLICSTRSKQFPIKTQCWVAADFHFCFVWLWCCFALFCFNWFPAIEKILKNSRFVACLWQGKGMLCKNKKFNNIFQSQFLKVVTITFFYLNSRSRPEVFCKNGVLKSLLKRTWKHLCWSLFLIKWQVFRPTALSKKDSNTGIFL